nr:MAG TPA: hypothetical protein [Caudoviricetes sp.]
MVVVVCRGWRATTVVCVRVCVRAPSTGRPGRRWSRRSRSPSSLCRPTRWRRCRRRRRCRCRW